MFWASQCSSCEFSVCTKLLLNDVSNSVDDLGDEPASLGSARVQKLIEANRIAFTTPPKRWWALTQWETLQKNQVTINYEGNCEAFLLNCGKVGFRCHAACENINMHYAMHRSNKVCHPVILHTNQEILWKPFFKWPLEALYCVRSEIMHSVCQKRRHPHTWNHFVTLGAPVRMIQELL